MLSVYAYFILANFMISQNVYWEDMNLTKVIGSAGLFLLQYIPSSTPDLPLILLFLWSIILAPFLMLEAFYWLIRYNRFYYAAALGIILFFGIYESVQFGDKTIASYEAVKELKGTSLPVEELYATCGKPLYLEYDRGPVNLKPHWIYTNGHHVISMTIDTNGIAAIYEHEYIFFD
jgi:hypothetical protein